MRFITETAKMIAFTELWDEICKKRFKVKDEKFRRFRYGMQVNSLGLTELQPENNVYRILIQMLPVVMAKTLEQGLFNFPHGMRLWVYQDLGINNGVLGYNK